MKLPLAAPRCGHCHHLEHQGATCDVTGCVCPEVYFVKPYWRWRRRFAAFIRHDATRLLLWLLLGVSGVLVTLWVLHQR